MSLRQLIIICNTLSVFTLFTGCHRQTVLPQNVRPYAFSMLPVQSGIKSITPAIIKSHLTVLASDSMQGRLTTFPGQKKAARYLVGQISSLGLQPLDSARSYLQELPMQRTYLDSSQQAYFISHGDTALLSYRKDYYVDPRHLNHDTTITAPVVFAGYGIHSTVYKYDEYDSLDVKGKWILLITGEPQMHNRISRFKGDDPTPWASVWRKYRYARDAGAAGLLIIQNPLADTSQYPQNFQHQMKRLRDTVTQPHISLRNAPHHNSLPEIYLSPEKAEQVLQTSGLSLATVQQKIDSTLQPMSKSLEVQFSVSIALRSEQATGENVVGILPGSDPELRSKYVVISAHYDHLGARGDSVIYNGADDNASGSSSILSVAQAFTQTSYRPKRSLLFLWMAGEEEGLLGSTYFTEHPPVPLTQITADINMDMVGRNDPDSIFVIGSDMLSMDLYYLNEVAASHISHLGLSYRFDNKNDPNRFYYRSDHYNFAKHNIPVVFYFCGIHKDYHQPTDTAGKIDYNKAAKVAKLTYLTAWGVANYPDTLKLNGVLEQEK